MEMAIVAEDRKSMLQGTRRNPHIIGRNWPTTASEITIHGSIMVGRLNVDHQLIDPIRRQKPLQFLAIFLLAPAHRKTTEQFAEHNTVESNPQYSGQNLSCLLGDDPIATKGFVIRAEFFQTLPIG